MVKTKDRASTAFSAYEFIRPLGEGGGGLVWEAKMNGGPSVAIKFLKTEHLTDERRKRFKNEITFCETIRHPNIVPVLDRGVIFERDPVTPFFVMPLYKCSFRSRMQAAIEPKQLLIYFDRLLSGVEAAHLKGVTHRDLKPENVLYDESSDSVLVTDFGIAQFADEAIYTSVETAPSSRMANFVYAAPEQRDRRGTVDSRSDIYSLGLILNEILTGEIPHGMGFKTVSSVLPQYEWVDEIVGAMIQSDPARRPQSVDAIKNMFLRRSQDYVERQRISEISKIVVPVGEEDDPLAIEAPRLVGVDWKAGRLILKLSRAVNPGWVQALQNMGGYASVMGYGPEMFGFAGDVASVSSQEHTAQAIIDHFKAWLPKATQTYRNVRAQNRQTAADNESRKLHAEQEELERAARIRASLRF